MLRLARLQGRYLLRAAHLANQWAVIEINIFYKHVAIIKYKICISYCPWKLNEMETLCIYRYH